MSPSGYVRAGVAYMHEGVAEADARIVYSLFESGAVQVSIMRAKFWRVLAPSSTIMLSCAGSSSGAVYVLFAAAHCLPGSDNGYAVL